MQALRGGKTRGGALMMGLTTEEDLEEMATAWETWMQTNEATFGMIQGEILIQI
jgi:hypothetical protein